MDIPTYIFITTSIGSKSDSSSGHTTKRQKMDTMSGSDSVPRRIAFPQDFTPKKRSSLSNERWSSNGVSSECPPACPNKGKDSSNSLMALYQKASSSRSMKSSPASTSMPPLMTRETR